METSYIQTFQKIGIVDDKVDKTLQLADPLIKQSLNFGIVNPELTYDQVTDLSLCLIFRKWIDLFMN